MSVDHNKMNKCCLIATKEIRRISAVKSEDIESLKKNHKEEIESLKKYYEEKIELLNESNNNFNMLDASGHVYKKERSEDEYTVRELCYLTLVSPPKYLFDFSYEHDLEKNKIRSRIKENKWKIYCKLASLLANEYIKMFNKSAPRMKLRIGKDEHVVQQKTGMSNLYPISFLDIVENFIMTYPYDKWELELDNIKITEDVNLQKCSKCKNLLEKDKYRKVKEKTQKTCMSCLEKQQKLRSR